MCTGLTFCHARPRRPAAYGGVERLDQHALVPGGQRLLQQRRGLVGRRAEHARHPVRVPRGQQLGQRVQPRGQRLVEQVARRPGAGSRRRTGCSSNSWLARRCRTGSSSPGTGAAGRRRAARGSRRRARRVRHGSAADQLDQLGHAVGHLAQRAGPDPHVVAVAVHLDAGAVQLELDGHLRRRGRRARRPATRRGWRASAAPAGRPPADRLQRRRRRRRARCRAVSGSRPDSMNARRTVAAGTSAAAATASSTTPSSAPWRSSPVSSRMQEPLLVGGRGRRAAPPSCRVRAAPPSRRPTSRPARRAAASTSRDVSAGVGAPAARSARQRAPARHRAGPAAARRRARRWPARSRPAPRARSSAARAPAFAVRDAGGRDGGGGRRRRR